MIATQETRVAAMLPAPYEVRTRRRETSDTFTLTLQAVDGEPFPFSPGQFNMVSAFGIGEAAISIAGDPARPDVLVHTIRSVGGVTRALERLRVGEQLGIRGPYGHGWPVASAVGRDVVFVAGGIGLAPLRPAIFHALTNRDAYESIWIIYGARSPSDLLYTDELHEWRSRFDLEVDITVDRAGHDWHGEVGVVTRQVDRIAGIVNRPVAFVCGPEIMMKLTAERLLQAGTSTHDIHLSLERNMKCGIGFCGHCQYGPDFVCRDGPVLPFADLAGRFLVAEL